MVLLVLTVLLDEGPTGRQDLVAIVAALAVIVGLGALAMAWRADRSELEEAREELERRDGELRQERDARAQSQVQAPPAAGA